MTTPVIKTQGLRFEIGGKTLLQNISLAVPCGQFLVIIGPNGAGKTTLLKCLMRIYRATAGTIEVHGRSLGEYNQRELAKLLSYVPQSDGRILGFNAYEFVAMGRYPHLSPFSSMSKDDRAAVWEAMDVTDTTSIKDQTIETLSGGERQRVFIAAALAQGAKILLLDEPTTFLDPLHQSEVLNLLARLNREMGLTIIAVTHDINGAALFGDQVLALKYGEVAFWGDTAQLMTNSVLSKIYDKDFTFMSHPKGGAPFVVPEGRDQ